MRGLFVKVVLPVAAVAVVLFALLAGACGFIQGELTLAAAMKYAELQKAMNAVFIVYLFVVATAIVPSAVLKLIRTRNALLYLVSGAAAGLLAEHCYFVENDVWDTWDFSAPQFTAILIQSIRDVPSIAMGMVPMLPESAIPVGVGVVGGALFWFFAVRRKAKKEVVASPVSSGTHLFVSR